MSSIFQKEERTEREAILRHKKEFMVMRQHNEVKMLMERQVRKIVYYKFFLYNVVFFFCILFFLNNLSMIIFKCGNIYEKFKCCVLVAIWQSNLKAGNIRPGKKNSCVQVSRQTLSCFSDPEVFQDL